MCECRYPRSPGESVRFSRTGVKAVYELVLGPKLFLLCKTSLTADRLSSHLTAKMLMADFILTKCSEPLKERKKKERKNSIYIT